MVSSLQLDPRFACSFPVEDDWVFKVAKYKTEATRIKKDLRELMNVQPTIIEALRRQKMDFQSPGGLA
jgi:hypothetical protein